MSKGTAIQVITADNDHSFTLDESALKKILLDPRVKDSKVIVLSIAGAFRTGKSFLLNFFLRYLYAGGSKNWMGDPDAPLKGFDWQVVTEGTTTRILMWSDPFEVKLPSGEKAFVLLMDTQGLFRSFSTVKDSATVFALSTILSSVQVYNVMTDISENDFHYLQFITEYGRMNLKGYNSKPFQDLSFLVRDWSHIFLHEHGWKGGEKLLAELLEVKNDQHEDLQQVRQHLRSCFDKIGCCLMPHPGKKAATNQEFDGRLSDIDDDFKLHVEEFVSSLMSPEKLVVKEINGTEITGKEFFDYFKECNKIFQGNKLPELSSIFKVTAEANNQAAVRKGTDLYKKRMDLVCTYKPYVDPKILEREHDRCQQEAVQLFQSIRKMGGEDMSRDFQKQLERQIEESYANYEQNNSALIAAAKANNDAAVSKSVALYKKRMELAYNHEMEIRGGIGKYVYRKILNREHDRCQQEAIQLFQSIDKIGGEEEIRKFLKELQRQINESYAKFAEDNRANKPWWWWFLGWE